MNEHVEGYRHVLSNTLSPSVLLRLLADPLRLRCAALLCLDGLHLDELTQTLNLSEATVLRHLASLRLVGVLHCRQGGRTHYYQLHPQLPAWARELIHGVVGSLIEMGPFNDDRDTLTQLRAPRDKLTTAR